MQTLSRKRVLVRGASSGIGYATARRFASENWDVCAVGRRQSPLKQLVDELPQGHHLMMAGDYSQPDTSERLTQTLQQSWGGLDVLVNSAGVSQAIPAIGSDWKQWRYCLDTMLDGAIRLSRLVVPLMTNGGRIIHITSIHSQRAEAGMSSYSMAKAAIEQYCRALALELAEQDILVNAIAPGFVDTPMSSGTGINELETDWFKTHYVEGHHLPLRRTAKSEEISGVVLFLAGPDATYITGQTLIVDGGLTITF